MNLTENKVYELVQITKRQLTIGTHVGTVCSLPDEFLAEVVRQKPEEGTSPEFVGTYMDMPYGRNYGIVVLSQTNTDLIETLNSFEATQANGVWHFVVPRSHPLAQV